MNELRHVISGEDVFLARQVLQCTSNYVCFLCDIKSEILKSILRLPDIYMRPAYIFGDDISRSLQHFHFRQQQSDMASNDYGCIMVMDHVMLRYTSMQ